MRRFATDEISYGNVLVRGMEVGAAGLVLAFGLLLLAGYMASERLVGFLAADGRDTAMRT